MVLVAEHSPAQHRGWLVGITNSFAFGATFAPLLGSWSLSAGLGWRFPFLLLALPSAINLAQSFFIKEPERFLEMRQVNEAIKRGETVDPSKLKYPVKVDEMKQSRIKQILSPEFRRTAIILAVYSGFTTIFWSSGSTYWTTFLPIDKGLTYQESLTMFGLIWGMSEPGYLAGAFLGQVTGRNQMMRIGNTIAAIGSFIMVQFAYGFNQVLITSGLMMFGAGLIYGTNSAFTAEIFPTRFRAMISAFTNTISSAMQAVALPLMPILAGMLGWSMTYQLVITLSATMCVILLFFLPKPKPKAELEELVK
jgi:MFS family permease